MKTTYFNDEPMSHALVWKWHRRGLVWICETHDGHMLKVKAQRKPRGPFKWYAETWLPTAVESTGRHYDTADQAQEECLRFLKKWRDENADEASS